jgi:hypothetical protein
LNAIGVARSGSGTVTGVNIASHLSDIPFGTSIFPLERQYSLWNVQFDCDAPLQQPELGFCGIIEN